MFVHRHLGHLLFILLNLVPAHQFSVRDQKTVCWAEETQGRPGHLIFILLDLVPAHQFSVHDQKTVCWAEETQGRP